MHNLLILLTGTGQAAAHPGVWSIVKMAVQLLGALGLFLFGMRTMSNGIQRAAGDGLREILNHISSNRFLGVLTGFAVTAIIQSSSATTVMAVSFVNAGLLTLQQSIGIIMGANIGTTITGWIVSTLGFKVKIDFLSMIFIAFGMPMIFSKNSKLKDWGEFLIGFGILFMGLSFMKDAIPTLNPDDVYFLSRFVNLGFLSVIIFVFAGILITVIVHSSSASMAITLTLVFNQVIPMEAGAAMILGGNIGTTIDAMLASSGANVNARRSSAFHVFFNVFGVILAVIFFKPLLFLVQRIVPGSEAVMELAMFHTIFNLLVTLILIGFIPQLSRLIEMAVRPKKDEITLGKYKISYITSTIQDMPETHIIRVKKEVSNMVDIVDKMFDMFIEVWTNPDKRMGRLVNEVKKMEEYTDDMQEELQKYLLYCSGANVSKSNMAYITSLMRIINELESIGDSSFNLIILVEKKFNKKIVLHETASEELVPYTDLVKKFLAYIKEHIKKPIDSGDLSIAFKMEEQIDEYRSKLKKEARREIKKGSSVKGELLFIDIVRQIERIGDYCLNIAQAMKLK